MMSGDTPSSEEEFIVENMLLDELYPSPSSATTRERRGRHEASTLEAKIPGGHYYDVDPRRSHGSQHETYFGPSQENLDNISTPMSAGGVRWAPSDSSDGHRRYENIRKFNPAHDSQAMANFASQLGASIVESLKRKWWESPEIQIPLVNTDEDVLFTESKKARKRRRRFERMVTSAAVKHHVEDVLQEDPIHLPYSEENDHEPPPMNYPQEANTSTVHSGPLNLSSLYYDTDHDNIASSSSWVSSMAMAAEDSISQTQITPAAVSSPLLPLVLTAPSTFNPPTGPASTLPLKPPPPTPIGMPPDADPKSKHGVFISSTESNGASPYIPNPACTLVMEQMPKASRSTEFINTWAKGACGTQPVHIDIDSRFSKALIEFATADLARLAWSSPRLYRGTGPSWLKHNNKLHLLGKIEGIRVWWYRVDGISTGVGEIEEGEIEGEVIDKESTPRKETKKERKARLAKERQAKTMSQPSFGNDKDVMVTNTTVNPLQPPSRIPKPSFTLPTAPGSIPTHPRAHGLPPKPASTTLPPKPIAGFRPLGLPLPDNSPAAVHMRGLEVSPSSPTSQHNITSSSGASAADDMEVDMEVDSPSISASFEVNPGSPQGASREPPRGPRHHPSVPPKLSGGNRILTGPVAQPSPSPPFIAVADPIPSRQGSAKPIIQPPSEPRAMKNAPKKPTFVKRSFLARQKELEERIARSKAELGMMTGAASPPLEVSLTTEPDSLIIHPTLEVSQTPTPVPDAIDRQALEDNLRLLVRKSQKAKAKSRSSSVADEASSSLAPRLDDPSPLPSTVPPPSQSTNQPSLDDLAETFITESIQEAKATPPLPPTATMTSTSNASLKVELAAKSKLLEQQIAESKLLMSKLAQARTKREKDAILLSMREHSRTMEETKNSLHAKPLMISRPSFARLRVTWPEGQQQTILELSDSESSDMEE